MNSDLTIDEIQAPILEVGGGGKIRIGKYTQSEYKAWHTRVARRLVSTMDHKHHLEQIYPQIEKGARLLAAVTTACEEVEAELLARHLYFRLRAERDRRFDQTYEDHHRLSLRTAEWLDGRKKFKDVLKEHFDGMNDNEIGKNMVDMFHGECVLCVAITRNHPFSKVPNFVEEAWRDCEAVHDCVSNQLRLVIIFSYVSKFRHTRLSSLLPCSPRLMSPKLMKKLRLPKPFRQYAGEEKLIRSLGEVHEHCIWIEPCQPLEQQHLLDWPPEWLRKLSREWPVDILNNDDHWVALRNCWPEQGRPKLNREDLIDNLTKHFEESQLISEWERGNRHYPN